MIKHLFFVFCLGSAVMLTACNTVKGAGQDIQTGGQKLENAADKAKN